MADRRQPTQLVAQVASRLDESIGASTVFHDTSTTVDALNFEQDELAALLVAQDKGLFLSSTTIDFVADQQVYSLPDNLMQIKLVEMLGDGTTYRNFPVPIVPFLDRAEYDSGTVQVEWQNCVATLAGRDIWVLPAPTAAQSSAWRVRYYRTVPGMTTGTAAAGAAGTITLAATATAGLTSSSDDYYNDALIYLSGGTGSGQTRTISDYVGDTRVASVSTDWSTTPDATSTYEILSVLKENEMEVLVLGAMRRLMQRDGEAGAWEQLFGSHYMELKQRLFSVNARPQLSTPRDIRITWP